MSLFGFFSFLWRKGRWGVRMGTSVLTEKMIIISLKNRKCQENWKPCKLLLHPEVVEIHSYFSKSPGEHSCRTLHFSCSHSFLLSLHSLPFFFIHGSVWSSAFFFFYNFFLVFISFIFSSSTPPGRSFFRPIKYGCAAQRYVAMQQFLLSNSSAVAWHNGRDLILDMTPQGISSLMEDIVP